MTVSLADIEAVAGLVADAAIVTPMEESRWLQAIVGGPVLLKCENLQRTGSFKIRGAYVRLSRLSEDERARGVVAASAGNHAQGVALAAQMLGIKATVFMPEGAPIPKANATRGYGAEVRFSGEYLTQALVAAQAFADETGAVLIHPFDHTDIVAGPGHGRPRDPPAGSGGRHGAGPDRGRRAACGNRDRDQGAASRRARRRACRRRRLRRTPSRCGWVQPLAVEQMTTMADGIAVACPGDVPFASIQKYVDDVVTVSEDSISRALVMLLERAKMVVEPAGADRRGRRTRPAEGVRHPGRRRALRRQRRPAAARQADQARPRLGRALHEPPACTSPTVPVGWRSCSPSSPRRAPTCSRWRTTAPPPRCNIGEVEVRLQLETRGLPHAEGVLTRLREHGYHVIE